jgi:hypothetical protein
MYILYVGLVVAFFLNLGFLLVSADNFQLYVYRSTITSPNQGFVWACPDNGQNSACGSLVAGGTLCRTYTFYDDLDTLASLCLNPTVTLVRGAAYDFNVESFSGGTFYLRTLATLGAAGGGDLTSADGVLNSISATENGVISWQVLLHESRTIYYASDTGFLAIAFNLVDNPCNSSTCINGGTCTVDLNNPSTHSCMCVTGYSGADCQTNINECASSPCINGGTCNDGVNQFNCACAAGYNGTTCQTNINECDSNPCLNGGTCVDSVNQYTCSCVAGHSGVICQINGDFIKNFYST